LIGAAAFVLGYCAFVLAEAWWFQRHQVRELESNIRSTPPRDEAQAAKPELIVRMEIARLGISAVVVEGSDAAALRRGIGHISGTPLPGQGGNVGIAGHRDTFFRPLRNIRQNDEIVVTTSLGEYRYRVTSTSVVSPKEVGVLRPTGEEVLTLVTCYPFYFVGSAPERFIVRGIMVPSSR
jgi:sortase A